MTATPIAQEYDPFSAAFQADPYPVYRWMRDEAPVFHSEKWGWYALSRFDDVRATATDPDTFASRDGIDIDDTAKDQSGPGFLPDVDNPRHDQVRWVAQPHSLPIDALLGTPRADTAVYCCGPEPLLAAVEQRCAAWPAGALHVERFAPRPLAEPARSEAFEVVLAQSELTLAVPPDRSILAVVEEAGIAVLSSCAEGTCGTCETAVLDGEPDHRDSVLSEEEQMTGDCMMICVSRSCSERLVLGL